MRSAQHASEDVLTQTSMGSSDPEYAVICLRLEAFCRSQHAPDALQQAVVHSSLGWQAHASAHFSRLAPRWLMCPVCPASLQGPVWTWYARGLLLVSEHGARFTMKGAARFVLAGDLALQVVKLRQVGGCEAGASRALRLKEPGIADRRACHRQP